MHCTHYIVLLVMMTDEIHLTPGSRQGLVLPLLKAMLASMDHALMSIYLHLLGVDDDDDDGRYNGERQRIPSLVYPVCLLQHLPPPMFVVAPACSQTRCLIASLLARDPAVLLVLLPSRCHLLRALANMTSLLPCHTHEKALSGESHSGSYSRRGLFTPECIR